MNEALTVENESLGTALPKMMAYVRDEVLPAYVSVGPPGAFAASMIRADLDAAATALAEGDVTKMIYIYQRLKDIKL